MDPVVLIDPPAPPAALFESSTSSPPETVMPPVMPVLLPLSVVVPDAMSRPSEFVAPSLMVPAKDEVPFSVTMPSVTSPLVSVPPPFSELKDEAPPAMASLAPVAMVTEANPPKALGPRFVESTVPKLTATAAVGSIVALLFCSTTVPACPATPKAAVDPAPSVRPPVLVAVLPVATAKVPVALGSIAKSLATVIEVVATSVPSLVTAPVPSAAPLAILTVVPAPMSVPPV